MDQMNITRTKGEWPVLTHLLGATVKTTSLRIQNKSLTLTFESGEKITLPPAWQFASCLLATSSEEPVDFSQPDKSDQPSVEMDSTLIGLQGAKLTAIESDNSHLDLVFGSIRISLTADT